MVRSGMKDGGLIGDHDFPVTYPGGHVKKKARKSGLFGIHAARGAYVSPLRP